jgi:hypothetical protein
METLVELGGLIVGLLLTVFILSYVIGDNPLYRLAVHILVGVSAAFAAVVVVRDVFAPILASIRVDGDSSMGLFWLIPLILALLLLLKAFPRTAWLGNSAMASLIGIGAAVGLVGAVAGTLLPQILIQFENVWIALTVALLTILTLAYFFFTGRVAFDGRVEMPKWYPVTAYAGRIVITITLAALFAAVINTSLVLLIQRVAFYSDEIARIVDSLVS